MNHTSIRKISLTTLALVAALAVTVRASGPSNLPTSAVRTHGGFPQHSAYPKLLPDEVYQIDDGSAEDAVGLTLGGDIIALNQFGVITGQNQIGSVNIAWGTPVFPDPTLDGLPYTVVIWDDPNGNGEPSDANVLATASGVISDQGTDTFIDTTFSPAVTVTDSFFVGFLIGFTQSGQFPCAFDETNPTFSNRSYIAGGGPGTGDINDLTNNDLPVAPIESFGLVGNWLIRADPGQGGGGLTFDSAFSEVGPFDIGLPFDGSGIEDRSTNERYSIFFVFNNALASVASADTTCGRVSSVGVDAVDTNQAFVNLDGVGTDCNESEITVSVSGVVDEQGNTLDSANVTFGLLIGDVNADRVVDRLDYRLVRADLGQHVDTGNLREDVASVGHNSTRFINPSDLHLVRRQQGTSLP